MHLCLCFGVPCGFRLLFAIDVLAFRIFSRITIPLSYLVPSFCDCMSSLCAVVNASRFRLLLRNLPSFVDCLLFLAALCLSMLLKNCSRSGSRGRRIFRKTFRQTIKLVVPCTAPAIVTLVSRDFVVENVRSFGAYELTLLFIASFFWVLQGWWSINRLSRVIYGAYTSTIC